MAGKAIILGLIFLALFAGSALAIEGYFNFWPLNSVGGWLPWTCVVEHDSPLKYDPYLRHSNLLEPIMSCPQASKCPPLEELTRAHGYAYSCIDDENGRLWTTHYSYRQISIPEDIKVVSDSFVISDEICPGDKPSVNAGNRVGEWWSRGGVDDSPPVQWVDDAVELSKKIVQYHKDKEDEKAILISQPNERFIDEFGIAIYPSYRMLSFDISQVNPESTFSGNVVCSFRQKGTDSFAAGSHIIGDMEVDIEADVMCFYYFYDGMAARLNKEVKFQIEGYSKLQSPSIIMGLGVPNPSNPNSSCFLSYAPSMNEVKCTVDDLFRVGTIKFQKKLKVVEPTEAKLEIQSFASPPEGRERLARFVIANKGSGKASIDGLKIRGKEIRLTCDSKELGPGKSSECIAIIDRNERNLRLAYTEEPCGKPKHASIAVSLKTGASGEEGNFCESSSDCSTGEECCVNLCRPAAEGVCDDIDSDGILDTWVPFE